MILDSIKDRIGNFGGRIGICYVDICGGKSYIAGNCDVFAASGSVKLFTLIEAFRRIEDGSIGRNDRYRLKESDYLHSDELNQKTFGALEYLHAGAELTVDDLLKLSIAVSDNIAFNILLKLLGADAVNRTLDMLGLEKCRVRRGILEREKMNRGIENTVSVEEVGMLLHRMYKGQIISRSASAEMLSILTSHQRNGIIPYYFDERLKVAHQTGYDDTLIMDMGVVYSQNPFVLSMAADDSNTRNAESMMRDITWMCCKNSNGKQPFY